MVEIIVVVIIIAVLATMIVPKFFGRVGAAKQSAARQKLIEIEKAVDTFRYDYERFPTSLDELVGRPADISSEKWQDPSLKPKDLIDPWGREFQYRCPGQHGKFDLYCLGADGAEGGEGEDADIVNW
jgi:general secretion pathway protein G